MRYRPNERILSDEFINTLLITAAEEVEFFRSDQPDYSAFEKQRSSWNNTLSGLGESLLREYDSAVHRAFIDYQELLENYFIVKGLTEGLGGQIKPPPEGEASAIPGLEEAERRLRLACRQFVGRLDEKAGAQCVNPSAQADCGHRRSPLPAMRRGAGRGTFEEIRPAEQLNRKRRPPFPIQAWQKSLLVFAAL